MLDLVVRKGNKKARKPLIKIPRPWQKRKKVVSMASPEARRFFGGRRMPVEYEPAKPSPDAAGR